MKNKKMKLLLLLAYFALSGATVEVIQNLSEDEFIISKIVSAINISDFSVQCKSDLNSTVSHYRERKAWAVASKTLINLL